MAKAGCKSKYYTLVKPRFDEIKSWLELGATDKEIIDKLGVNKSTFYDYLNQFSEFSDLIKKNRQNPVQEIKLAMLKRAKGFNYSEKKIITQYIDFPEELENVIKKAGIDVGQYKKPKLVRIEDTTKTALPDVAASLVLLQHWDKDENGKTKWARDPKSVELKEEELKLRKIELESKQW